MEKIGIITAAFRRKYLDYAVNSVLNQTYKNWEYFIVNDNSDEIREWYQDNKNKLSNYPVFYIDVEKNCGKYGLVTRNIGTMVAINSGCDRIKFVDDDNMLMEKNYLENAVLTEEQTNKIPFSDLYLKGKKPDSTYERKKVTSLARQHIDLSNVFYRKEHFLQCGYFDDSNNKIMFDWDFIEKVVNKFGKNNFVKLNNHIYFRHKRY